MVINGDLNGDYPKKCPNIYFLDPRGSKCLVIYIMESQDFHHEDGPWIAMLDYQSPN